MNPSEVGGVIPEGATTSAGLDLPVGEATRATRTREGGCFLR